MLSTQAKALKDSLLNEIMQKANKNNEKQVERIVKDIDKLYNLTLSQIVKICEL